ncbi:hypothetical protein [Bradyrhizobium sp. USDA 4486]
MANTTVDAGAVIGGIFSSLSISEKVAQAYDDVLFEGATLQDLPGDTENNAPRFVTNATNVQSAALWRFSRPYMSDYLVGLVKRAQCFAFGGSCSFLSVSARPLANGPAHPAARRGPNRQSA